MCGDRLLGLCFVLLSCSAAHPQVTNVPENGFVPDEKTAIRIAEAVVAARYGERTMIGDRPFTARLRGDVWTVVGSDPCGKGRPSPSGDAPDADSREGYLCVGGSGWATISKTTGQVLETMSFPGFPRHPARRVSSGRGHGTEDQIKAQETPRAVQA